jgi:hypothetical protein
MQLQCVAEGVSVEEAVEWPGDEDDAAEVAAADIHKDDA